MLDSDQRSLPSAEATETFKDEAAGPIFLVGKQDGFVIAANARGIIEHPLEIGVGLGGRFHPAKTKLRQLRKSRSERLVEYKAVGENVDQGLRGAVERLGPLVGIIA